MSSQKEVYKQHTYFQSFCIILAKYKLTIVNIAFTIVNMKEKRKFIPLPEWIESAIREQAKIHHRAWSREAVAILEEMFQDKKPINLAEHTESKKVKA